MQYENGRQPLRNCVLEMIKNELLVDHYYINPRRTILVKVDADSVKQNNFECC